jgi:hypothetical protein
MRPTIIDATRMATTRAACSYLPGSPVTSAYNRFRQTNINFERASRFIVPPRWHTAAGTTDLE